MTFKLELLPKKIIEQINTENGRFYLDPQTQEMYPSVTTVLKGAADIQWLEEWRARIGEEEAKRQSLAATRRGISLHKVMEDYVLGNPCDEKMSHFARTTANRVKSVLDKHVSTIYGVELTGISSKLKTAGTTDLFCLWDGTPAIVDFKTANYSKREEWIRHYFVQGTVYAIMFREMYGVTIPKVVIIVAPDFDHPQVFDKSIAPYINDVRKIFITDRK